MDKRTRVGVIFGGRSGEHEVSLMSARSVMEAIDRDKYDVVCLGIDKEGRWITQGDPMQQLTEGSAGDIQELPGASAQPALVGDTRRELVPGTQQSGFPQVDVVFPVLHGPFGEDGTLQGLLELADLPYVGAGVTGSAVGMDKAVFKAVMRGHGLPIVDYILIRRGEWEATPDVTLDRVEAALGYPIFTKPANLGSSVGICRCSDREQLAAGLAEAALYDRRLLAEAAVPAAREIELSVLGNDDPIVSVPGEVIPSRDFYSYESKYIDTGDRASELLIPAPLPRDTFLRVQDLAARAYRAIDCAGMARADFLLSGTTGELYVNELNTIPGFTAISMYPKLWEASGIPYTELIDRLIQLALDRYGDKKRSLSSYVSLESAGKD
ncbi:MAG TPA: D-alanine--D-alanine ligase family protein [Anaerolineae bacterium]|nr:D-alanine--D-alanine ligase family protein [Anaerolineae bacterium]